MFFAILPRAVFHVNFVLEFGSSAEYFGDSVRWNTIFRDGICDSRIVPFSGRSSEQRRKVHLFPKGLFSQMTDITKSVTRSKFCVYFN